MRIQIKFSTYCLIFIFFQITTPTHAQTIHSQKSLYLTPAEIELLLVRSSIEFHAAHYQESIQLSQKIISNSKTGSKPVIDALELQALCYKKTNQEELTAGIYKKLIQTAPASSLGPYQFELGTIRFKQKKYLESKALFQAAFKNNFNPGTSLFFLGLHELDENEPRLALENFSSAKNYADHTAILPILEFYTGTTYLQLTKTESAIRKFNAVLIFNDETEMLKQAKSGSEKTLKELNTSALFSNASISTQWDSNVQSNPQEVSNAAGLSSQRTFKTITSASLLYSTSPIKKWQFNPSYSFYGNYNFNSKTRSLNFISHTGSFLLFYKPYERFSRGFKVQSTFSFKNSPTNVGETLYTKYSITEEIGPSLKYELSPRIFFNLDIFWKPKHYYNDPVSGDTRRSGGGFIVKPYLDFITSTQLFSPQTYLAYELDDTLGKTYDMHAFSIGASNASQINPKLTFRQNLDASITDYSSLSPSRKDKYLSLRLSLDKNLNKIFNLNLDSTIMKNISTQPSSYSYSRITSTVGIQARF